MSETGSSTIAARSPWPRRLAIAFGVVVVLVIAGYFVLKAVLQNYIADKIEEEFGDPKSAPTENRVGARLHQ